MDEPIFIVGASRSGTTMLRLILNAHPRLGIPQEFAYFHGVLQGRSENWRMPELSEDQYHQLVRKFLRRRSHVFLEVGVEELEQKIMQSGARDLREPYRIAASEWATHFAKPRWGEKTPKNLHYVDILADMFPAARFLYLIRDPRAVVSSMNRSPYYSPDSVFNALNWRRSASDGYHLLETVVAASNRMTIRYEDLIEEPAKYLQIICSFIGESFYDDMLEFHRESKRFMGPVIRTPSIMQPIRKANSAKWKDHLTNGEIAAIQVICRDEMNRFGYEQIDVSLTPRRHLDLRMKSAYWNWMSSRNRSVRGYELHHGMLDRTRNRFEKRVSRPFRFRSIET